MKPIEKTKNDANQEIRAKIARKVFDKLSDFLPRLYGRWLDEKEYEDIKDYAEPIKKAISTGVPGTPVTFLKMNKRPFGFDFTVMGGTYTMFHTGREVGYKRIK